MKIFVKDPQSTLDYVFDWALWLGPTDTISLSTFVLEGTLVSQSESKTATTTTIFISGGTVASTHEVINSIVTVGGRRDDRTIALKIRNK